MREVMASILVALALVGCSAGGPSSAGAPIDASATEAGGAAPDATTGSSDGASPPADGSTAATTCTSPGTCSGRIPLGGWTLPYLSNAPVELTNPAFTDLVVFIEGLKRDAANDFATMVGAANAAGASASTLLVTPEFQALVDSSGAACTGHADTPAPTDLLWYCDTWSEGAFAVNAATVSSFGALDALLAQILAGQPQITRATVAGFSAGGQFTQRYVAASHADAAGGPAYRYVVGDPSSYLYFDVRRPVNASTCTTSGCPDGFAPFQDAGCPGFDRWKYGTDSLQGGAASLTPTALRSAYVARPVTYLLGELDDGPTTAADYADLDTSCAGEAQGPFRYQRGLAYFGYATTVLDAGASKVRTVPGCAHSPSCVFKSDAGVGAVFGP
jgi:hypothetical protein